MTRSPHHIKSSQMSENTGLLIAGSITLGILLIILAYALWWFLTKRNKFKEKKKSSRLKGSRRKVVSKTPPEIKVNTIEFTVPTKKQNHQPWQNGSELEKDDQRSPLIGLPSKASSTISRSSESLDSDGRSESGIPTAYGLLRPDLYASDYESDHEEFPANHIGRIWYRLEYDCEAENLYVTVVKIENLPTRQQRGSSLSMAGSSTCDSFVRIYLLPDEKRYLQTKVKKRTRNPKFLQKFAFSMSYSILRERTLRFSVFDVDRFSRQTVIGHGLFTLESLDITLATEGWIDLKKIALPSTDNNGEILVSLTFLSSVNRMALTIIKATGLHHPDFPTLSPYVKVSHSVMGKVSKTKKSHVHRENSEPDFDLCCDFKINPDILEQTCLTIEVMHSTSPLLKHDKSIGRVDIGGSLVSRGKELDHWSDAVSRANSPVKEWHYLK